MPKSVFTDANKILVELLVTTRKAAGLRQEDLAAKIGKDQTFISKVEQGQRRVDVLEFYAFARAMNQDPVEFYSRLISALPAKVDV